MSKPFSRENTAPKMKGAGDGVKTLGFRSAERIPVPSSRKFSARATRDESAQLKLKKVLDEIEAKQGKLKKAKSVAEITPTKSKKAKSNRNNAGSTVVLHATPRPTVDEVKRTPSRRANDEGRLQRLVYGRMLLFVWRRSKARLAIVSESLRRRQEQVCKLENQVDCLKDLTQSECAKRNEAINEHQKMENMLQNLQMQNQSLQQDKVDMHNALNSAHISLQNLKVDLENTKNDLDMKNTYLKRLENEIQKGQLTIRNMKEENSFILNKLNAQQSTAKLQEEEMERMIQTVGDLEDKLQKCETAKQMQALDFHRLSEQFHRQVQENRSISSELNETCSTNEELQKKITCLEEKLTDLKDNFCVISNENEYLQNELDRKPYWWQNAKDFMTISWIILQNAAYIMLPAL